LGRKADSLQADPSRVSTSGGVTVKLGDSLVRDLLGNVVADHHLCLLVWRGAKDARRQSAHDHGRSPAAHQRL
jgi:hypothetical protein